MVETTKETKTKPSRSKGIDDYLFQSDAPIPADLSEDWEFNEDLKVDLDLVSNENYEATSIAQRLDEIADLVKNSETEIEYSSKETITYMCDSFKDVYTYINKLRDEYMDNAGASKLRRYTLVTLTNTILSSNFFDIFGIEHFQTMEFNSKIVETLVDIMLDTSRIATMALINKIIKKILFMDTTVEIGNGDDITIKSAVNMQFLPSLESFSKHLSTSDLSKLYIELEVDLYDLFVAKICLDNSMTIIEYEETYDKYIDMSYDHIVRSFNMTHLDETFIQFNISDFLLMIDDMKDKQKNIQKV